MLTPIQVSFSFNKNHPEQIYYKEDLAKASDRMMKFQGIDAAFTLGLIEDGVIYISARSGKRVNVGKIMAEMGGGGTIQSAAARIPSDDIFKLEEILIGNIPKGLSEEEDIIDEPPVIKRKQAKKL